ncbi:LysE/ArgO family amino acid transporter [Halopseudomonas yangmingensis]|uniref:L-lysine exporter family protein LysE/ArgO n=1 Tax=Halopseudomonas yangmingensis TaxID=1720063 RepID=A0A1I4TLZ4_9GAMM|nr:LysE family transporter [Halopseudomonas yangmingensis]SFM77739.1 L-lysine exporter family protein LysE/ArgO [Halopseudomonas yangmingensis]
MVSFFSGFGLGISLIAAIGAQNAWVLSHSMRGQHRLLLAGICIGCDCLLILLGIFALDALQGRLPQLVPVLTLGGVAMLLWLGSQSAWRAWRGNSRLQAGESAVYGSAAALAAATLAITLLNPHVYLDTVVLLGSVGARQSSPLLYALGACLASAVWFGSLTGAAPTLARLLRTPRSWQLFDAGIALMLLSLALGLLWGLVG